MINNSALKVLENNGIKLDDSLIDDFLANVRPNNPYHQVFKQIVDICRANGIPIKIEVDNNLNGIAAMRDSHFTLRKRCRKKETFYEGKHISPKHIGFNNMLVFYGSTICRKI